MGTPATAVAGRGPEVVRPWAWRWVATGLAVAQVAGFVWLVTAAAREALVPALPGDVLARYLPIANLDRPWVEQAVEFPPLSVLVLTPLRGITDQVGAVLTHMVVQGLLQAAIVAIAWRCGGVRAAVRYLVATLPLLPLLVLRLDLFSVALVALGLWALAREQDELGGTLLGAGVLAKVWPGVLLVVMARRRPRATVAGLVTTAVGGLVWVAWTGWDAVGQVLGFRGATGWHMESIPGVVHRLVAEGEPAIESGAWRLGTADGRLVVALGAVGVLGLLWRTVRPARPREDEVFVVTLLLVVAPLLSPQYLAWLALLVALAPPRWSRDVAFLVASVTSMAVIYWIGEIIRGEPLGWGIVVSRNLALLVVLAVAARPRPIGQPGGGGTARVGG